MQVSLHSPWPGIKCLVAQRMSLNVCFLVRPSDVSQQAARSHYGRRESRQAMTCQQACVGSRLPLFDIYQTRQTFRVHSAAAGLYHRRPDRSKHRRLAHHHVAHPSRYIFSLVRAATPLEVQNPSYPYLCSVNMHAEPVPRAMDARQPGSPAGTATASADE